MKPMQGMQPMAPMAPMKPIKPPTRWWPESLGGNPSSTGGQNESRYAFFAGPKRLAVDDGRGNIQVYDTGDHRITGVQQHQDSDGKRVTFSSQHGEIALGALKPVSW